MIERYLILYTTARIPMDEVSHRVQAKEPLIRRWINPHLRRCEGLGAFSVPGGTSLRHPQELHWEGRLKQNLDLVCGRTVAPGSQIRIHIVATPVAHRSLWVRLYRRFGILR